MDLNAWLEEYRNDESLREFFDAKKWAKFEGYSNGHEEGIEEGGNNKAIEIAKNMLKETSVLKFISRITELPLKKVQELQKESTTEK